ncbi:diadenosine tetraphosphatase [Rhodobacterales bacterium 52_120_T64]|nr:diadenosine tetraphosphatase [Rhodobacterales bacterium 52_120_T64]
MKVTDLGDFEDPILVFGGPYSNLQAFDALKAAARRLDIPAERIICTGDVVAYCADAEATAQAVREFGCAAVAGNCEKQLAERSEDCACGFDSSSQCSILARGWYAHALDQVSQDSRDWMASCPDIVVFTKEERRYAVVHGGLTDISRFIWPVSSDTAFIEEFSAVEEAVGSVDGIIAGHSGIPFVYNTEQRLWINAGAIGMPPNDGSPDTTYVTFDDQPRIHRLRYDFNATRQAMENAELTQGYHETLSTGLWPSEDSLPCIMRHT